jgi:hypothetical protein
LTRDFARQLKQPYLVVDLNREPDPDQVQRWLREEKIQVLNVAGPRESTAPGIAQQTAAFLRTVLEASDPRAAP